MSMISQLRIIGLIILTWTGLNNLKAGHEPDSLVINTVLWEVRHPDTDARSYLFGTHHAFGPAFFDTLAHANECVRQCELVFIENFKSDGQTAGDIINGRDEVSDWKKLLPDEDLKFLNDLFKNSPTDYHKMSPAEMFTFLNRHYNSQFCLAQSGSESFSSLDDYIGIKAQELGKEVRGFETISAQIEMINKDVEGMPAKVHRRRLSGIIRLIRSGNSSNCEETDWYRKMNIDYQFDQICTNSLMLTDRNNRWMPEIIKQIESRTCFIAVGLSHLKFECGLITQLRELGYKVTPVNVN